MAHASEDIGLIFFDALATAAAKSQLAAVEFARDEFHVHRNACRQSGNPSDERLPVRLSGGNKSQHVRCFPVCSSRLKILPEALTRVKERRKTMLHVAESADVCLTRRASEATLPKTCRKLGGATQTP